MKQEVEWSSGSGIKALNKVNLKNGEMIEGGERQGGEQRKM